MVSRLDSKFEHMVLNQEPKMYNERIPQQVQENQM
jgi:hypothetical protein